MSFGKFFKHLSPAKHVHGSHSSSDHRRRHGSSSDHHHYRRRSHS